MGAQAVRLTSVDIDNALNNNHFEVIFQPIFNLKDGSLLRMEAFVRWVHPGLGVLPPGAFISFFENQGRMNELTRYVVNAALEQYQQWRGNRGPGFSVNLAFSDLTDTSFPDWLMTLLAERDFPAEHLTLECPTLPAHFSADDAAPLLAALKETGVRLAIEMRGRANDLLRELTPFPFDEVKTGGSAILRFARTVRGGPGLTAISELLELARANDACTIAVGVEDQASLQALASLGFMAAQGNYLAGIGKASDFEFTSVNDVREALSLDRLSAQDLAELTGETLELNDPLPVDPQSDERVDEPVDGPVDAQAAEQTDKASAEVAVQPEAVEPHTPVTDTPAPSAEEIAVREQEVAKRKAQIAARKRAIRKAAALKEAAERAQKELEEKQHRLQEAAARREAEENARKLQERLSRAYDETADEPAASQQPATAPPSRSDEESSQAGLLLGGSLAETALGRRDSTGSKPAPAAAETARSEPPEPVTTSPTATAAQEPDQPVPDTDLVTQAEAIAEPQQETLTVAAEDPAAAQETTARDYHFVFAPKDDTTVSLTPEAAPPSTGEEIELKSEDEILDEAFEDSEELDPLAHHEEDYSEQYEVDSTERYIAEKLLRAPRQRRRKGLLQRRYRITHFWPRSWKRKWQADRARKQDNRDSF